MSTGRPWRRRPPDMRLGRVLLGNAVRTLLLGAVVYPYVSGDLGSLGTSEKVALACVVGVLLYLMWAASLYVVWKSRAQVGAEDPSGPGGGGGT
ncbi:hypothetical protein [Nocardioides acrostichi]|uniref:Uncharacterized protein n=1 Tax=Nocardioides acrostichi TaxID=2784339 RepID=A0A930Y7S4_9ACTN|nr:hypothetical protein [Nocardioides acrostichi]MBF4163730.1 hypothetical protein [Nocardioides acrostichi]